MISCYLGDVGIYLKENSHYNETLLITYNALEKYIASYAVPVGCIDKSDSSSKKIHIAENMALNTATGGRKMTSIDHLHQESHTLKVNDYSDMISAQYPVNCLEEDHVCHGITTQDQDLDP